MVVHYPPATLPSVWGCDAASSPCSVLQLSLSLLTGSKLGWSIQGHIEVSIMGEGGGGGGGGRGRGCTKGIKQ